ncbi:MAG: hypothetical protein GY749_05665 [Desulfobacteraceae bacterium]|nr:hypothetical protein [Desulfobacteraceae bacterium]
MQGITVRIYGADGSELANTVTDENGKYVFPDLLPGDYRIEVSPADGTEVFSDPDGVPDSVTALTDITDNKSDLDFGYHEKTSSLGGFWWSDLNQDGIQDSGEPGVVGVTVNLLDAETGDIIAAVMTNEAGYYEFTGLSPDEYILEFVLVQGYDLSVTKIKHTFFPVH